MVFQSTKVNLGIIFFFACVQWGTACDNRQGAMDDAQADLAVEQAACLRVRTLVRGAHLPSVNGMAFSPAGRLYVTSVVDRSLMRLNAYSGRIIERLGPENGVEGPDDLAISSDGTLYFTAFLTGSIGKISPDGTLSQVAQIGPGVNAITLSDDNRLFVSRVFLADDVWEVDPEGFQPPRLIAENLGGFNGMDVGSDGLLYGPLWFKGQIARIDVETGELEVVAGGLGTPAAVKFDDVGYLYALDQHRAEIVRIDVESGEQRLIARSSVGLDNLAFGPYGWLYVTNAHEGSLSVVLPWEMTWPLGRPGLTAPGGVALRRVNGRESLFVADVYSLREFSPRSGRSRSVVHSVIGGVTALKTPFTVAPFGDHLVTTSWFAHAVQVWDPVCQDVIEEHLDFSVPLNAIDFQGDLVVAELLTGRVVRRPTGTQDKQVLAGGMLVPTGLAADFENLYAADWATGLISQVVGEGHVLNPPVVVASGLAKPEGMALTPGGDLLVVESAIGRLTKVDLESGQKTALLDDLDVGAPGTPGYPPSWIFNSVAVDDFGAIYLTVGRQRKVLKIRL
jgi:sugar lactone lactonase YvrE